ncbi:MAG: nicotinamidase/pyrazinamidase [Actinomycetota bacterium]|nr:nicotinamidase/pyrazinamidase [Actinomycetota bacterium]
MTEFDSKSALIVVDVQNDFADIDGSLYIAEGEKVVPFVNEEISRAREAGAYVAYTQDWHPEVTAHFQKDGGIWPVHCVADSWGAAFHPDLEVDGDVVRKGTGGEDGYSGFTVRDPDSGEESPTQLETMLREHGVERVVVVGLATDYCVKETAIDAVRKGFATEVPAEGIRAVNLNEGDGDRAIEEMERAGVRVS